MARSTNLPLLDMDVLRTFVAIAELGSFTQAAKSLAKTPAAVSLQIKRLEALLEQTLFERSARRSVLTREGETLLTYSRKLLRINQEAVAQFLSPGVTGMVKLGVPDNVGTQILPPVLSQLAQTHPAIQVDVLISSSLDLASKIHNGQLDLALITTGHTNDDVNAESIYSEPLVWAGRKGGLAHEQTPLPLALANLGCAWRQSATQALDEAGINYRIAYTSESCTGIAAALQADLAVSPMPLSSVKSPLVALGQETDLPTLGGFDIKILFASNASEATNTLADYIRREYN